MSITVISCHFRNSDFLDAMKDNIYRELVNIARIYLDSCTLPNEEAIIKESKGRYSFKDFYRVYWYFYYKLI